MVQSVRAALAAAVVAGATALSPASNLPTGWSYLSCYTDSVSNRVLNGATYADYYNMTGLSCIDYCGSKGYDFAGTGMLRRLDLF